MQSTLNSPSLQQLDDRTFEESLRRSVANERAALCSVLEHLAEADARRLFLKRGYGSLFEYCTKALGFSEGAASRRIEAMRLSRQIPTLSKKIESGELSLTNVSTVSHFMKREEKASSTVYSPEQKVSLLEKVENVSKRECEKILLSISPEAALPREQTRQVTPTHIELRLVADVHLIEKLEKVKSLASHKLITPSHAELLELLCDEYLKKNDPELAKPKSAPRSTPPAELSPSSEKNGSRYIPAAMRREVWAKAQGKCQHRDTLTQKICGSSFQLQIDHVHPLARGGKTELENLELVCRGHNTLRAIEVLGEDWMVPYLKRRQGVWP